MKIHANQSQVMSSSCTKPQQREQLNTPPRVQRQSLEYKDHLSPRMK